MPTKVYQHDETEITWLASGGTNAFTCTSLAAGAGRQGARHDFSTSARSDRFAWRAFCQIDGPPVVGEVVRVYWKTDGTTSHPDNDDGTGDIAVSAEDKLKNLQLIGSIIVDEAAADVEFASSGEMSVPQRYGHPVFWNATADTFSATASEHGFIMTPIPMESQEA